MQLCEDSAKKYTWLIYYATEGLKRDVPTWVLVVAPDKGIAEWARRQFDPIGGFSHVVVLGPEDIPLVETPEDAGGSLLAALLSLASHYDGNVDSPLMRTVFAMIKVAQKTNPRLASLCIDFLELAMDTHVREATIQQVEQGLPVSDHPLLKALVKMRKAEGKAEGEAKGFAKALIAQLSSRFGAVTEATSARIFSAPIEQLKRGLLTILNANRPEEVLEAVGAC